METDAENITLRELGIAIRDARKKQSRYSQSKLAIEIGLSENQIGRIERGESNPTIRTLCKIAAALEIPLKEFFKQT